MNRIYNVNDEFFSTWTDDMAYILGFISADGCVKDYRRLNICIKVQDIEILEYIKRAMNMDNPIRLFKSSTGHDMCELDIRSTRICSDLLKLNVTSNKTYTIVTPNEVPNDYINHYIRGIFDGDGGISTWMTKTSKQPTAECTLDTASSRFADRLSEYLIDAGINSRLYIKKNKIVGRVPIYRIRMCGKNVIDFCEFIYTNAKFYLLRKYSKFIEYYNNRVVPCIRCNNLFFRTNIHITLCDDCS